MAQVIDIIKSRLASPKAGRNFLKSSKRWFYWAFRSGQCRYRAERLANCAARPVENPWNLFPSCSLGADR